MSYSHRFILGALAATALLTACSRDVLSPDMSASPKIVAGSGTSGGGTSGGGTGGSGGGGVKAPCTNKLSVTADVTQALSGNAFTATTVLAACQGKTKVYVTSTDLANGLPVFVSANLQGFIALWTLPSELTTYRVDAKAVDDNTGAVVATASTIVSTTAGPPPCQPFIRQTVTVGYYSIYPAVWAATDAQDCGSGGTVHLRITNLKSGLVELEYAVLPTTTFVDFEGPIVSYNTPYRVLSELRSSSGALIASSTTDTMTPLLQ
jgi:hypothetical protein